MKSRRCPHPEKRIECILVGEDEFGAGDTISVPETGEIFSIGDEYCRECGDWIGQTRTMAM